MGRTLVAGNSCTFSELVQFLEQNSPNSTIASTKPLEHWPLEALYDKEIDLIEIKSFYLIDLVQGKPRLPGNQTTVYFIDPVR